MGNVPFFCVNLFHHFLCSCITMVKLNTVSQNDFLIHMIEILPHKVTWSFCFSPENASQDCSIFNSRFTPKTVSRGHHQNSKSFTWTCVESQLKAEHCFLLLNFIYYFSNYHFQPFAQISATSVNVFLCCILVGWQIIISVLHYHSPDLKAFFFLNCWCLV